MLGCNVEKAQLDARLQKPMPAGKGAEKLSPSSLFTTSGAEITAVRICGHPSRYTNLYGCRRALRARPRSLGASSVRLARSGYSLLQHRLSPLLYRTHLHGTELVSALGQDPPSQRGGRGRGRTETFSERQARHCVHFRLPRGGISHLHPCRRAAVPRLWRAFASRRLGGEFGA